MEKRKIKAKITTLKRLNPETNIVLIAFDSKEELSDAIISEYFTNFVKKVKFEIKGVNVMHQLAFYLYLSILAYTTLTLLDNAF